MHAPTMVYGEGKKQKAGSFKENLKYSKKDYRFTFKNGAIYVFIMSQKPVKAHIVKTLRAAAYEGGIHYHIQNVELLGFPNKVRWKQDEKAFRFEIEGNIDRTLPLCVKLSVD